jgi:hypothetical protein
MTRGVVSQSGPALALNQATVGMTASISVGFYTLDRAIQRASQTWFLTLEAVSDLTYNETIAWDAYIAAERRGRREIPLGVQDARHRFQSLYDHLETEQIRAIRAKRSFAEWIRQQAWAEIRNLLVSGELQGFGYETTPRAEIDFNRCSQPFG